MEQYTHYTSTAKRFIVELTIQLKTTRPLAHEKEQSRTKETTKSKKKKKKLVWCVGISRMWANHCAT